MKYSRRKFLHRGVSWSTAVCLTPTILTACNTSSTAETTEQESEEPMSTATSSDMFFNISLAQWSLHKMLKAGELDNLDFAAKTRNDFGIEAVEYVNQFFMDKAKDEAYLQEMNKRAADNGVKNLLVMIDGEGPLGSTDAKERNQAIENHHKWVEAAKILGCHSIRVNAAGKGTMEEVAKSATEGLRTLSEYAKDFDINVIVENHGGYSSNAEWLSGVIAATEMDNCGTLTRFWEFLYQGKYF